MSDISDLLTKNQILCLISDRLSAENAILRAERDMAIEERDRLRKAMKPFADAASGDDYIDDIEIAETDTARKITFGNLRRARAALEGETNKI